MLRPRSRARMEAIVASSYLVTGRSSASGAADDGAGCGEAAAGLLGGLGAAGFVVGAVDAVGFGAGDGDGGLVVAAGRGLGGLATASAGLPTEISESAPGAVRSSACPLAACRPATRPTTASVMFSASSRRRPRTGARPDSRASR